MGSRQSIGGGPGRAVSTLLVTAGLLVRTVQNLRQFDPGFNRDNLYAITTNFFGYKGPQTGAILKQIWDRIGSLPGARAVGVAIEMSALPQSLAYFGRRLQRRIQAGDVCGPHAGRAGFLRCNGYSVAIRTRHHYS